MSKSQVVNVKFYWIIPPTASIACTQPADTWECMKEIKKKKKAISLQGRFSYTQSYMLITLSFN